MADYRVISSDNHVFEPVDLWTGRGESKFKDRFPHIESLEQGDWWVCDGMKVMSSTAGSQAGLRFEEPEKLSSDGGRIEDVRPGGYIPEEHIKDMDIDGIDVSIVYPTVGLGLYSVPDSDLLTSMFSTYNDWVGEFCSAIPKRLKGIAMLNIDDVDVGVKELERCAKLGFVGAMIPVAPAMGRPYDREEYKPLWAAAQDLGIPLSLHIQTNRPGPGQDFGNPDTMRPALMSNVDHWVRMALGDIIFSGAFERYPKLQVGSVEMELSWAPHFLDRIDYNYTQRDQELSAGHRFKGDALPSDFFHNNVFLGFQEDALGIRDRHIIGVDNLMWGGDYPHEESTFPRSRQIIEEILVDCTEGERAKIAGGNAARVYGFD